VLLGAEWNAEIERGRQIEAGHPADREPLVESRRGAQERALVASGLKERMPAATQKA
jgi:hypothetical protein